MSTADLNNPACPWPAASVSLFDAVMLPPQAYCEAFSSPASAREHWRPLLSALDARGKQELSQLQDRVKRKCHEHGATFNPFDDPTEQETPWALDIIPLPFAPEEWANLETGLIQRARLLDQILADTYGAQNLLKNGQMPAELVFANPHFLHQCHGIRPAAGKFLTYYAADLYRGVDGRFRVLRDYGANPIGLGYALENRIVSSHFLSDTYHNNQIHRLAPFFQTFHRNLIQRAALHREDHGIVLLSPGPDSLIYFEHALLSRYLGYPLVEGQDLTMRNGKLFLKKLDGLEEVEAIFRHTGDNNSDPFALRRKSADGVAGLIQVSRENNVDIVNPIGSGFIDTPVLPVFLPNFCRELLKEELLLKSHPAWWCGTPDGRNHVMANMNTLNVTSAMSRSTTAARPSDLMNNIAASPHAFMAQEQVSPSMVPVWDNGRVNSHYSLLRVFACATDQGFAFMPGGLAITAANVKTLTSDRPERQQSKDVWVLSDKPVEPVSLMSSLQQVSEFSRSSNLPSRVADHLLWLGRYLERAEGLTRLLLSVFRRLSGESSPRDIPELPFLLNLLREKDIIPKASTDSSGIPLYRELLAQLNGAMYQSDKNQSVATVLKQVQKAARHVRDRLSPDSWRVINRLETFPLTSGSDPLEVLDDTLFNLSAFSGLAMESMTRGLGWRFMDMGRRLERAMNQASLVRIGLPQVCRASGTALEAMLEVSDSIMTYRARYQMAFQLAPVLDLLLMDETNPKSLAFQFSQLAAHVEHLPRQSERSFSSPEERIVLEILTTVRLLDLTGMLCTTKESKKSSLAASLESMEALLKEFAQQVSAHYLSRVPTTPHFSIIPGNRKP